MAFNGIRTYVHQYAITLIVAWSIIIGLLAAGNVYEHRTSTIKEAESEARQYLRLNLFYREWAARMGGVYVPVDKAAPNPYIQMPNRDITTHDNRRLTLVNPAYMNRMVFESLQASSSDPIISKITSLKPINPANAPDEWERQSLVAFERKQYAERSEITAISGKPYLRLISKFDVDEACLKCHAHQGYRVGDVRGAIVISAPLTARYELQSRTDRRILGGYGIIWLFGSVCIVVISRKRSLYEDKLRDNEEKYRELVENIAAGVVVHAPDSSIIFSNPMASNLLGLSSDQMRGKTAVDPAWSFLREDGAPLPVGEYPVNQVLSSGKQLSNQLVGIRRPDMSEPVWVLCNSYLLHPEDDTRLQVVVTFTDITKLKQANELRLLNEKRLRKVIDIVQSPAKSIQEFLDTALNEAISLTESRIGFISFYHEDLKEFELYSWSRDVMKECAVADPLPSKHLDKTGLWGEAVRQRKPVILNDFVSENPLRKGCPEGHVPLSRFMSVPVFSNGRIVASVGVANKRSDYDENDVLQLTLLMDAVWKCVENRRGVIALQQERNLSQIYLDTVETMIVALDAEGTISTINRKGCEILGYREDELIGKFWFTSCLPQPEGMENIYPHFLKIMSGVWGNTEYHENHVITKNGELRLIAWHNALLRDERGQITGSLSTGEDITKRTQIEHFVRESNERFSAAFNNAPIMFTISSLDDGTYLDVNQKFLDISGFSREEVVGKTSIELGWLSASDRTMLQEKLRLNGNIKDFELILHAKSGQAVLCKYWGEIISVAGHACLLSIALDITEHRKIEQQLLQSQKMESIGNLAGGIAHDFNNKLSVIICYAYLAANEPDPALQHNFLDEISKAAEQSADLTRQLLAFARKQTVSPKVLDLNETVAGMLKMLQRLIGENINLTWQPAADLWPIEVDPSQIDQILANLCVNARDSISGIGRITIETLNRIVDKNSSDYNPDAVPGEYVTLTVSDTGCGMDKETMMHIFEPFFTTKGVGEGTGLGLATVFGIVRQNNGFINVSSEPGVGTMFTVYLPRHISATEQANAEGTLRPPPHGDETILLVEDEKAILNIVATILTRLGYTVLQAGTPGEAVHLARENAGEIHLLITDVIMPEMNGYDLAASLQALRPDIKCLFMSGYTDDIIARYGVHSSEVHFIHKPFSLHSIAEKVREVIDGK